MLFSSDGIFSPLVLLGWEGREVGGTHCPEERGAGGQQVVVEPRLQLFDSREMCTHVMVRAQASVH